MKYQKELLISLLAIIALAVVYAFETHKTTARLDEFSEAAGAELTKLVNAIDEKFDAIDARLEAIEKKQGGEQAANP